MKVFHCVLGVWLHGGEHCKRELVVKKSTKRGSALRWRQQLVIKNRTFKKAALVLL